jgi:heme-degrading monooxygenase HmoA
MAGDATILINPFEVPADADDAFVGAWERTRDFLEGQPGYVDTALHRALNPDADFRFVNVARWASPEAFQAAIAQPGFPGGELPVTGHPALYRVVREDATAREAEAPAVLINAFEVPAGADDEFLTAWERTRDVLKAKGAYLSTRLHQALSPDAQFRFVNVARWESPQAFQAAIGDRDFQEAAAAVRQRAHPGLYEVVRR